MWVGVDAGMVGLWRKYGRDLVARCAEAEKAVRLGVE